MFKNLNVRNILILIAAVIGVLLVLGLLSSVVNALLPISIAAVIGFALGRASGGMSLREMLAKIPKPARSQAAADTPSAAEAETIVRPPARAEKRPAAPVSEPTPEAEEAATERLTDFVIKDAETLSAEARQLEERVAARNRDYDPAAALEERRRRLLGDQSNE